MTSSQGDLADVPGRVRFIIASTINSVTCPFTILLNVLVIMAVKRRPRLQTNSNILLACLAVTDALTGLIAQPSFVIWNISQLHEVNSVSFNHTVLLVMGVSSVLHLMFVTFERLVAIKFTMRYSAVITKTNIKITVTVFWTFSFICGVIWHFVSRLIYVIVALVLALYILFVPFVYVILYHETRRHRKIIKTQQLPIEEVERYKKENKALKTTAFIFGTFIVCLLPIGMYTILRSLKVFQYDAHLSSWIQTSFMLNSLVNPLIYFWRQEELRKFVFGTRARVAHSVSQ